MTDIGYHASHEQFPPADLVRYVERAEEHGFADVLASDHYHPWSERQGESGHVWSWLGAAMQATSLPFGTVNAPGYRYHPAVIAQAAATLRQMYPGRFWLSVGSGEFLNEHITGGEWPEKADRNARLAECVDVMRRLWDGETVTHRGHVTVEDARLFTRPSTPPPVIGAALSAETARWLADIADGMITVGTPDLDHLESVVAAFRDRAPEKPVYVKAQLSYADDAGSAVEGAYEQWRTNAIPGAVTQNLRTTAQFDDVGETISRDQVAASVHVSADPEEHIAWLAHIASLGVEKIVLHNVNRHQISFIETFGDRVLPALS